MSKNKYYTKEEEAANTVTHGLGILLGIVGGYILINKAIGTNSGWAIMSVAVYLMGMLASYISSTFYHACHNPKRKAILRKIDHGAIYAHIAGTYTPFTLISLREADGWGWSLFAFIWLAAIIGICMSFKELKKHSNLKTICFVIMGGSILVACKPLMETLSPLGQIDALYWLIGGGVSYIIGAIFYSWTKRKYMHAVFHLFVLGGSICHMIAIYTILQ